jgi:hypothetical protein
VALFHLSHAELHLREAPFLLSLVLDVDRRRRG